MFPMARTVSIVVGHNKMHLKSITTAMLAPSQLCATEGKKGILFDKLAQTDPLLHSLINKERERQFSGLELIASENYTSQAVLEANGSVLTNKYSEGLPGGRYYGGNEVIDLIESLCIERALALFGLDPSEWGCNVQPLSGSAANFCAYTGVLQPGDRIMGLDLPSGGHLTHGYQTCKKKVSSTSVYFQSLPYQVDPKSGLIDYEGLEKLARIFHPRLIICGGSAYPREWDYAKFRSIADSENCMLMCDMAHISGLVATGQAQSPFPYCDLVTTTTHKTLRGPRSGIIFFRKRSISNGHPTDLEARINSAVFPGCQGGPHDQTIAAVATALAQAATLEFQSYGEAVRHNCRILAEALMSKGSKLATDGTDNHLLLWDLRPLGISGAKFEKVCEMADISVNKNSIHGDTSAIVPGGVRLGSAALTTRGMGPNEFIYIADLLTEAARITVEIQRRFGSGSLKDFVAAARDDPEIAALRVKVRELARSFPMPGY